MLVTRKFHFTCGINTYIANTIIFFKNPLKHNEMIYKKMQKYCFCVENVRYDIFSPVVSLVDMVELLFDFIGFCGLSLLNAHLTSLYIVHFFTYGENFKYNFISIHRCMSNTYKMSIHLLLQ